MDPSVVNVTVYPKVSQTRTASVDIINKNKLDKKLSIDKVELETNEIVIKGAEHVLSKVATVKALVDAEKIVDPRVGVIDFDDIKLVAYDADGKVVENIETEPNKIKASITVNSPSKEVPIKVIPSGDLEFGKAIESITTDITKVTVYGDQDILDKMEYLPLEVDISSLNQDKSYKVIVEKQPGIKEVNVTNVNVDIKIGDEVSREITDVSIETINLDSSYKAVAIGENSSKTSVISKGTRSVIDAIDDSEGEYEVEVKVIGEDNKASYTSKTTKIKVKISKK